MLRAKRAARKRETAWGIQAFQTWSGGQWALYRAKQRSLLAAPVQTDADSPGVRFEQFAVTIQENSQPTEFSCMQFSTLAALTLTVGATPWSHADWPQIQYEAKGQTACLNARGGSEATNAYLT